MESSTFLTKLPSESESDSYVVESTWNSDCVKLKIVDYSNSEENEYEGILLLSDLQTSSNELEIPYKEFLNDCKKALCTNGGLENFQYEISANTFFLKKVEDFKITYGSVELSKSNNNLKKNLLLDAASLINVQKYDIEKLKENLEEHLQEHERFVVSYEECIREKNAYEKEIYNKLAALLNTKKEKIAELQELLLEKNSTFPQTSSSKKRKLSEKHDVHDSSNDSAETVEADTVFEQQTQIIPKRQKISTEPSTSSYSRGDLQGTSSCSGKSFQQNDNSSDGQNIFDEIPQTTEMVTTHKRKKKFEKRTKSKRKEQKFDYARYIGRKSLRDESDPFENSEQDFAKLFRLNKESFRMILETNDISDGSTFPTIPSVLKLAITLNALATGSQKCKRGTKFSIGMSQSTINELTSHVVDILEKRLCREWIKIKQENFQETRLYFYKKYQIPGIVGCIDGTHIFIKRPKGDRQIFQNKLQSYSINAMVICDHQYRIISVNARYGGSTQDSVVWDLSNERHFFKELYFNKQTCSRLLGDVGYPLEPWLITPYGSTSTDTSENTFNSLHTKAQSKIRTTINLLKARWGCLKSENQLRFSPEKCAQIINVCSALHNISLHYNLELNGEKHACSNDIKFHSDCIEKPDDLPKNILKKAEILRYTIKKNMK